MTILLERDIRVSYQIKSKRERKRGRPAKREKMHLPLKNLKSCILLSF